MDTTVVISFGRNVGTRHPHPVLKPGDEMGGIEWTRFNEEVRAVVRAAGYHVFFSGSGVGIYEGVSEESRTIIAGGDDGELPALRDALALLAFRYYQDSVAVTAGETVFAGVA